MALQMLNKCKTLTGFTETLTLGRLYASQAGADAAQCLQEAVTPKVGPARNLLK